MNTWRKIAICIFCLISLCASTAGAYLSAETATYLLDTARSQVFRAVDEGFPLLPSPTPFELDSTQYEGVVIRFHYEGRHAVRGLAEGPDLRTAYLRALAHLAERHADFLQRSRALPFRVSLSLFTRRRTIPPILETLEENWLYGCDGVALRKSSGFDTILTPIDYLGRGMTKEDFFKEQPLHVTPLTVHSWSCRESGPGAQVIIEGAPPPIQLTPSLVRKATLRAARYLMLRQEKSGQFRYEYDPCENKNLGGYNMVRHAGVLWAMLRLYRTAKDERLLETALSGTRFLIKNLDVHGSCAYLGRNERSVLGGTALAILALVNLPNEHYSNKVRKIVRALGRGILSLQHASGAFFLTFDDKSNNRLIEPPPKFYPGECLLALAELWKKETSPLWSLAARKAAHNQISAFHESGVNCHWSIQGIVKVGLLLHSRPIICSAGEMSEKLIKGQNDEQGSHLYGSWPTSIGEPTACSAACRLEALGPAIEALRSVDEPVAHLERTMLRASQFIINQQFREDNAFLLHTPIEALGGIRRSPNDYAIRMDINQHAIAALLNTLILLRQRPCLAAALVEDVSRSRVN